MQIVTGHKKQFNTVIARSGAGKTLLCFFLLKLNDKPKIIIDKFFQFEKGLEMTFTEFVAAFNDTDFVESFYKYNKTIILRPGGSIDSFFELVLRSKKFHDLMIFIDEIDVVLGTAKVNNDSGFYELINRGRHKDLDLLTTCRNTANIPKPLIAQTDFFYFSDLIEKGAINFVEETLKGLGVAELLPQLEDYEFLKVDVNNKILERLKTDITWLKYFN